MNTSTEPLELRRAFYSLKEYLWLCLGISFFMTILYLAPIGYMRDVYGPVINSRSLPNLYWVTALLLLLLVVTAYLDWIRQKIFLAASIKFSDGLFFRVFDATFRANLLKMPGARVGLNDLRSLRSFIASPMMGTIVDAPFGLFFLILVFAIHPTMGYLSVLGAVLTLVLGIWTEKRVRPLMSQAMENANNANGFISDSGRNAQVIHAMGMMRAVRNHWTLFQNKFLAQQAGASAEQAIGSATSRVVMLVQGSALLGVGTFLTLIGHLPPSAGAYLIIAKLLGAMAIRPTMQLIHGWKQVVAARESYERLERFLAKLPVSAPTMKMPAPVGHLTAANVVARPPSGKVNVVYDLSFDVAPGQVLTVIGPSGSGKSSLARLLVGIWRPVSGSVRLDGVDISSWDKDELGPHIGYLPQDVELFEGSIAQNIARFEEINQAHLEKAIELAGLHELMASLPNGLNTNIGDCGSILSGGQRQRVGIARAMYGDPKLIVLDEPNSSLDQAGEYQLIKAIEELKKTKATTVLITHRKALLKVSDLILVLKDGRPKIFGARDKIISELMKQVASGTSKVDRAV